jgi:hypothetical protein
LSEKEIVMSRNGKSPAYKADKAAATEAETRLKNNPFEPNTRRHRMFEVRRNHSIQMDSRFEELEAVYGSLGTPRVKQDNPPWAENRTDAQNATA